MKLLIIANSDVGLYQFRKELIFELLKDHDVYIALPYGDLVKPLVAAGCEFIDMPLDRRGINLKKDVSLIKKIFSIFKQVNPDYVITYTIKPNIYGGYVSAINKVPFAVNITGLGSVFEKNGFLKIIVERLYKYSLSHAKVVFFENTSNRDFFVNEGVVNSNKTFVLNGAGVNLNQFNLLSYPENDSFHFLFVGRVMKEKGIDELLFAVKKLVEENVNCILDVVGPLEENYKEKLEEYGRQGWLNYYGYQKDVIPFYRACDCLVLPSYHEGMANTNLEAAACGRPLITSNIAGCKEAVIDGVTGFLCEPHNKKSLYNAMCKMLLIDPQERRAMGVQGRAHMKSSFNKDDIVNKTLLKCFE